MSDDDSDDGAIRGYTADDIDLTIPSDSIYTGSFEPKDPWEIANTVTVTLNKSDDTTTATGEIGYLGVPACPSCGDTDAVQLSTDEWICQNRDCRNVYEHESDD